MKQQKILWSMLAMIMVAVLSVGFVSCGDDDDDDGNNGSSNNVVGTWTGRDEYGDRITFTFKSNGTGIWREEGGDETDVDTFTYEMESRTTGIILLKEYDSIYDEYDTDIFYFEIDRDTMYVYEDYRGLYLMYTLTKR